MFLKMFNKYSNKGGKTQWPSHRTSHSKYRFKCFSQCDFVLCTKNFGQRRNQKAVTHNFEMQLKTSFTLNTWTALPYYLYLLDSFLSVYTQTATYCFMMKHYLVGRRYRCAKQSVRKWVDRSYDTYTQNLQHISRLSANYWTDTLHRHKKLWRRNRQHLGMARNLSS